MRDLTKLTPNENGNITITAKAELTPFDVFYIEAMQSKIYDNEDYIPLENWNDDEY